MIPKSIREQHIKCCGTCKFNIDVDGVMADVCGSGEQLDKDSFYEAMHEEEKKYWDDGANYFDQGEFLNTWLRGRWTHSWDICDEYVAKEDIA